jgi:ligand-binding SRPBCC domain-containing protein
VYDRTRQDRRWEVVSVPRFEASQVFPQPLGEVFDFFRRPANLLRVWPAEFHLTLIEGPERLELGSQLVLRGRRWGIRQKLVSEVTAFVLDDYFIDNLRQGPFGRFTHTHRFEAVPGGTRASDQIEYEPPGGLLRFVLTARFLHDSFGSVFAFRDQRLQELLGPAPSALGSREG